MVWTNSTYIKLSYWILFNILYSDEYENVLFHLNIQIFLLSFNFYFFWVTNKYLTFEDGDRLQNLHLFLFMSSILLIPSLNFWGLVFQLLLKLSDPDSEFSLMPLFLQAGWIHFDKLERKSASKLQIWSYSYWEILNLGIRKIFVI